MDEAAVLSEGPEQLSSSIDGCPGVSVEFTRKFAMGDDDAGELDRAAGAGSVEFGVWSLELGAWTTTTNQALSGRPTVKYCTSVLQLHACARRLHHPMLK